MDPDVVFIVLLLIIFLVLLLINTVALIKKISRTDWPLAFKIIIPVLLTAFLIGAPWYYYTSGEDSPYKLLMGTGAMIIGLNWSLNMAKSMSFRSIRISRSVMVILLTVAFTILLPLSLYLLGHLFDSMNIMGSSS